MTAFRIGDRVRNCRQGWVGVVRAVECLACGEAYVDGQSKCGHKAGGLTIEQSEVLKPWCLMKDYEPEVIAPHPTSSRQKIFSEGGAIVQVSQYGERESFMDLYLFDGDRSIEACKARRKLLDQAIALAERWQPHG